MEQNRKGTQREQAIEKVLDVLKKAEKADGLKKIKITFEGITPLMMNRMSEDQLLRLRSKKKPPKGVGPEETPRQEAARKLYLDNIEQKPYVPTENLMACLIAAGTYVRLDGKRQMSSAKGSVVPGFLTLLDTHLPVTPTTWEVDIRPGRNPNGGEAVCLCRPRFDRWSLTVTALLDTNQISEAQCRELFDVALSRIGIGEFRPSKRGVFGRSVIVDWQVL